MCASSAHLSVHYFNTGDPIDDTTGAEVCIARKPREHTAAIHSLVANNIKLPPHQATDVTAPCTPNYASGDIHIIQTHPHMHTQGRRLDTVIERANGTHETLVDAPFDFSNQISYEADSILKPGDTLLTTCHYQNDTDHTIVGGTSTTDEMCANFVAAWPAGSLYTGQAPDGGNGCYE